MTVLLLVTTICQTLRDITVVGADGEWHTSRAAWVDKTQFMVAGTAPAEPWTFQAKINRARALREVAGAICQGRYG